MTHCVILAVCVLAHAPLAWSQEQQPQIQVTPERPSVAVGEPFWVRVTVTSEVGGASVALPQGSPFEVLRQGGTSTSFSFSTGWGQGTQISRRETVRLQLRAARPGRHTLGPFVVTLGGRQYSGGTAEMEVVTGPPQPQNPRPSPLPGNPFPPDQFPGFPPDMFPDFPPNQPPAAPPPAPPPQPGSPGLPGQVDPSQLTGAVYDPELFLRTVVEPAEAYVGQQVVATMYIYTTLQLSNVNVTREASTDGFWSEDLTGPMRRIEFEDQFVGQTPFRVAVLRRVALFPLREGTLTVGAVQLEAIPAFRSIFSPRAGTVERRGVPVEVQVRPLPEKGRPADFPPGNVGRYAISARVDRTEVKVGEPVTLTVTVSGEGQVKSVKLPPLPEIEGTRGYEPSVDDAVTKIEGKLGGRRSWEYLILPQKAGELEIPAVELSFFDPVAERYETRRTQTLKVRVSGTARPNGTVDEAAPERDAPTNDDLAPLRSIRRQSAMTARADRLYERWWFLLAVVLAPLGFLVLVGVDGLRRRRIASRDVLRARRAAQVAGKLLRQVQKEGGREGLVLVARALHGFCADRYGEPVSGLTVEELRTFLVERDVPVELAERTAGLVERSEQARYGGGASDHLGVELAGEATELIRELDKLNVSLKPRGGGS